MALTMPLVIWSCRMCFTTSNWAALCLGIIWSAIFFNSELNFLNKSSNSRDRSYKGKRTRCLHLRNFLTDMTHLLNPEIRCWVIKGLWKGRLWGVLAANTCLHFLSVQRSIDRQINTQVCRLTDKPDLASILGPPPHPPGLQEATSFATPSSPMH